MASFRTLAICTSLRNRGVSEGTLRRYQRDNGHGAPHGEKVFATACELLDRGNVLLTHRELNAMQYACLLHDLTDFARNSADLDRRFPGLSQRLNREELGRFLIPGELAVTTEMVEHFHQKLVALNASDGKAREYHHLSGAILAFILLTENLDPKLELAGIDARLAALAILAHSEMDPRFAPRHPIIDAVMDSDTLAEFDIGRMIEINIVKAGRPLFDPSIPWRARMEMLSQQRRPEEVESDPVYGRSGRWLDTFEYTFVRLISNLTRVIYRDPVVVAKVLGGKGRLFDQALTDSFAATRKYTSTDPGQARQVGLALLRLIAAARTDAQYRLALPLLQHAEQRVTAEMISLRPE